MNFREIFERLVKLWAGKFRLSLRILKTHSVKLPEKVRGLEGTWGLLALACLEVHKHHLTSQVIGICLCQYTIEKKTITNHILAAYSSTSDDVYSP